MDIGKSFGYVFEDENWVTKVLIGGVLNLVPILNFAATGYELQVLKKVAAAEERPLPEWRDFGNLFVKGLLVTIAGLIYAIPLLLLVGVTALLSALSSTGASAGTSSGDALAAILAIFAFAMGFLAVVYGLLIALWLPAATVNYALLGDFGAFFRLGEIWSFVSGNLGGYIVALVVFGLASIIAVLVGGLLCFVGTAFTGFWAMLVFAHLFGQLAHGSRAAAANPPALAI